MSVTHTRPTEPLDSDPAGDRIRFAPMVRLSKAEAFGACQALADADRLLLRSGRTSEATVLGDLFELLEQRLAWVRRSD
ncbi:MAG TPA: hypothetical protein VHT49_14550 [Acidimicrobiales bacterium]|jgi:hypothetical protein|nr:hypothetical protein [Acidimicrobiales bacterium]